MNEKNKTTKDHYVPQFILRGFSNKNKKQYKAYVHDDILYPLKKFTINDLKELKNIEKSKFQGNQSKEYLYQNLQLLKEENEEYKDVAFHTGSVLSLANILDYSEKNHLKSKINKKNQYYQSNVRDIFSHKNFYACNVADENIDIEKNFHLFLE